MYSEEVKEKLCLCYHLDAPNTYTVCNLEIKITRRCNLKCVHCMSGDAQDIDIDNVYIDSIFSQIKYIYNLVISGGEITLATDKIRYILESIKKHNNYVKIRIHI